RKQARELASAVRLDHCWNGRRQPRRRPARHACARRARHAPRSSRGFVANGVTAGLVVAGSVLGWPMSTTHVASSAIIGAGAQRRAGSLNRKTVREMVLAWFLTLPAAGLFGTAAYEVLRLLRP